VHHMGRRHPCDYYRDHHPYHTSWLYLDNDLVSELDGHDPVIEQADLEDNDLLESHGWAYSCHTRLAGILEIMTRP